MSSAAAAPHKLQNYINGNFVDPIEGLWVDSFDPSTATVNAHVADSGAEDVENAVQAALAAFPEWSSYPVQKRADFINKLADLLESHIDEFALAESIDQGKTFLHAKNIEIPRAVYNFRFFAGAILHNDSTSTVMTGALEAVNIVVTQPVGVAGLISPWNLPLYLLTWKIAPAIAAGNTVVAKPSEFTSVTAWMFCRLVTEAGFPPGVINMVFGTGPRAGSALVKHPRVPLISFTGGTATGAIIQRDVASHCKKLSLELGGKNPNIIFADCNLDEAVATTTRSSFLNQGEICLCGSRIFVERSIYDTFLERFVAATKQLKVGDPRDPSTTTGALVSKPHYEKVLQYIQLAREEGGKIETGGDKPELVAPFDQGYFVNPTIITGLEPYHCRVQQEEIFGPVVTVWPFDTESEVVDYANSVKYGLSASLWTSNAERAMRISLKIHTGTVWVNCWMLRDLRIPFGGSKQSGIGREGGHHSLEFFTDTKTICLKFSSQLQ